MDHDPETVLHASTLGASATHRRRGDCVLGGSAADRFAPMPLLLVPIDD